MTKVIAQTYTYAQQYRALITLAFIAGSILAVTMYCVNVYGVVSHTIALQSIRTETTQLTSEVSTLDAQYLQLGSSVTPDDLATYGLTAGTISAYIPRTQATASAGSLAERGNEF